MGQVHIAGLGIVEIEGDEPNDEELAAILNAPDVETPVEEQPPQPDPVEVEEPKDPVVKDEEGPLGVVPKDVRGTVRNTVEEQPGLLQLLTEITPATSGALAGASVGSSFFPPYGTIAGAVVGGATGELAGQEMGISPESDFNLALSAGGPLLGPLAGGAFKGGSRLLGHLSTKLPFARAARARNVISNVVEEFESLGAKIIEKQKGLLSRSSSDLYRAVRRAGVVVPKESLSKTRSAISELLEEMQPLKAFPEVKQSSKVLKQIIKTIDDGADISMDTLVRMRQLLGIVVRRAESGGGMKLGSSKTAFKAISDDLDRIAADPSLNGRAARLAKGATQRAKLEFAVKDMESGVARFVKDTTAKDGVEINLPGFQKWLRDITNPKSKQFNKNFTDALKDEIPEIKNRLASLIKITGKTSPGGPGSLVIRGRLTSLAVGGMAGVGLGGPFGGAIGALIGTNVPEMLTALLTTKGGAAFLERVARMGQGELNAKAWALAGEMVTRSLGEGEKKESFADKVPAPKTL